MDSLTLSLVVISYTTLQGKPLLARPAYHYSAKLVPRPFRALQKNFLVCIKLDKGGNSLPKHFERNPNVCLNL